jgi:hypothetical protein
MIVCNTELWAPKEAALFLACVCRFGKKFEQFQLYVSFFRSLACT